jgi:hypothetical protein
VYDNTIGKTLPTDSIVLHHRRVEEILKWNQEPLDVYRTFNLLTLSLSKGMSRIKFILSWAASLYVVWAGSHTVLAGVVS